MKELLNRDDGQYVNTDDSAHDQRSPDPFEQQLGPDIAGILRTAPLISCTAYQAQETRTALAQTVHR